MFDFFVALQKRVVAAVETRLLGGEFLGPLDMVWPLVGGRKFKYLNRRENL